MNRQHKHIKMLLTACIMSAVLVLSLLYMSAAQAKYGFEKEPYYSDLICETRFKGKPTTYVYNDERYFIDCESFDLAIEFDWAYRPKNYDCFGQAGTYAKITGKEAVCVLMARTPKEYEFAEKQYSFANKLNIQLIVIKMYE